MALLYWIGLISYIPTGTVGAYLSLTIRELGFSTLKTNLMTGESSLERLPRMTELTWPAQPLLLPSLSFS